GRRGEQRGPPAHWPCTVAAPPARRRQRDRQVVASARSLNETARALYDQRGGWEVASGEPEQESRAPGGRRGPTQPSMIDRDPADKFHFCRTTELARTLQLEVAVPPKIPHSSTAQFRVE